MAAKATYEKKVADEKAAELAAEAAKAQAEAKAKADAEAVAKPKAATPTTEPATEQPSAPTGTYKDWMTAAGLNAYEQNYATFIIARESSWDYTARNASSGAYGLCQALPASKMATAGEDYMTNPITQLKWCSSYAKERYNGWYHAYNFWLTNRWW